MNKSSIASLFMALGYNWEEMRVGVPIDVSEKKVYVKSYNEFTDEVTQELLKKIVRKNDEVGYTIFTKRGSFIVSPHHVLGLSPVQENSQVRWVYAKYAYLEFLSSGYLLSISDDGKKVEEITIEQNNFLSPILDVEIQNTHCYFSNGVLSHNTFYGNPETTSGGNALKFYACHRLDIRRTSEKITRGDSIIGGIVKVKCIKNKIAPPFQETELRVIFGQGFDIVTDLINLAVKKGVIQKAGSWYSYKDIRLGQGIESVISYFNDNPAHRAEIKELALTQPSLVGVSIEESSATD
jgi:hypothetical protein